MTVKELRKLIGKLPADMPVLLVDISTDDPNDGTYAVNADTGVSVENYSINDDGPSVGRALCICFDNKLNPHPING